MGAAPPSVVNGTITPRVIACTVPLMLVRTLPVLGTCTNQTGILVTGKISEEISEYGGRVSFYSSFSGSQIGLDSQGHAHLHSIANSTLLTYNTQGFSIMTYSRSEPAKAQSTKGTVRSTPKECERARILRSKSGVVE